MQELVAAKTKLYKKIAIPLWMWRIYFFLNDSSTIYFIAYTLASSFGAFANPVYFAFHLVSLIKGVRLMRYVLSSVTNNLKQVIATLILALIILFWFAIFAYNLDAFRGEYAFEDQMDRKTLFDFLIVHIAYGFTVNPIWGGGIDVSSMLFIFIYFIIINLILTSIFSGIIIDSFSEMRTSSQQIQEDTENWCFICNISRDEFEKLGLNFFKHIRRDHYMWNYLFFRAHIESLGKTEMSGLQTYVFEKLKINSIDFYPIKKALFIEDSIKENEDIPTLFLKMDKLSEGLAEAKEEIEYDREKSAEEMRKTHKFMEKMMRKLDEILKK